MAPQDKLNCILVIWTKKNYSKNSIQLLLIMMIISDLEITMTVKMFQDGTDTSLLQSYIRFRQWEYLLKKSFSSLFPAQDYTREGSPIYHNASSIGSKVPERNQAACHPLRFETRQHSVDRRQRVRRDQDYGFRLEQSDGRGKLQSRSWYGSDVARCRHLLVSPPFLLLLFIFSFLNISYKIAYKFSLDRPISITYTFSLDHTLSHKRSSSIVYSPTKMSFVEEKLEYKVLSYTLLLMTRLYIHTPFCWWQDFIFQLFFHQTDFSRRIHTLLPKLFVSYLLYIRGVMKMLRTVTGLSCNLPNKHSESNSWYNTLWEYLQ